MEGLPGADRIGKSRLVRRVNEPKDSRGEFELEKESGLAEQK